MSVFGIDSQSIINAMGLLIVPGVLAWLRERDKRLLLDARLSKLEEDTKREIAELKAQATERMAILQKHEAEFKAGAGRFEEISNKLVEVSTKLDFVMRAVHAEANT